MQTTVSMTKPCAAVRGARAAAAAPARAAAVAVPRAAAISGRRSSLVAAAPAVAKRSAASRVVLAQAAPSATAVKYVAKQIPGDIGEAINAVRFLSIDGVNAANSGHPGLPMGCAPMATVLFSEYMKLNPEDPKWADRDRFVLSAGHGSMLQYSLLHLLGYPEMTVRFFFFSARGCWWWCERRRPFSALFFLIGIRRVPQRAYLPSACFTLCVDGKYSSTARRKCQKNRKQCANTPPPCDDTDEVLRSRRQSRASSRASVG